MANFEIVQATVPQNGINRLRSLKYGRDLERMIAPQLSSAFKSWLTQLAKGVAIDWPSKSGKSSQAILNSARVSGYANLESIRGYFLVPVQVAAHEYGTNTRRPQQARMLAIPILDGVYPDGTPKRLGPNSWRHLKTFVYKSKRTGNVYIAYRANGVLKIVYLLVEAARGLKELRRFRNAYDLNVPKLYDQIQQIVSDAIVEVYITQFNDALNSIGEDLVMKRPPSVIPDAENHAGRLVPKY